jgi:hypothetical protein
MSLSFLCICTYYKGSEYLRACKQAGNTVYFITDQKLEHKPWPRECIDEFFMVENNENTSENNDKLIAGVAGLMRSRKIDRIVALDDFDVEKGALLREVFRIPGMGLTTSHYFRDKLAMRVQAQDAGIKVPPFSTLFHDESITHYLRTVQGPWVIKPRSEASATGIKKVHNLDDAWQVIHSLGDRRHHYLIEQFKPGDVFHVDSLNVNGKIVFQQCSGYLNTPMEVAHEGGIFRSKTVETNSKDDKALRKANEQVMKAFKMQSCASHSEFIKSKDDGEIYFLETSSRVGGANIAEMVEAATGINLWREWANIETAIALGKEYKLPEIRRKQAGIIISLSRHQYPDLSPFNASEIVWRLDQEHHVGLILQSDSADRISQLLDEYASLIQKDYHASAPVPDKPTA